MAQIRALSAPARRAKVLALVQSGAIHSQSDLVLLLRKSGIEVTQATASRDLEEIGALRGRGNGGSTIYQLPSGAAQERTRLFALPTELILSVESSANMAVVRTPPGGAQLLASALDSASASGEINSVIGTIAGDDTVLFDFVNLSQKEVLPLAEGSTIVGEKGNAVRRQIAGTNYDIQFSSDATQFKFVVLQHAAPVRKSSGQPRPCPSSSS